MEKVIKAHQLTVVVENVVGRLAHVTGIVADEGVNIENVCAFSVDGVAVFHFLTDDNEKAKRALENEGFRVMDTEVILLQLWNRPGSLSALATKFRQQAIDLQYVYGTSSMEGEKMTMVFSAEDNDVAAGVFESMVLEEAELTV